MAALGRLEYQCGCRHSALFCRHELLQLSSCFMRDHPQQRRFHSLVPVAFLSSPSFSQSIAIDPRLQSLGSRVKTSLELTSPSLTSCMTSESLMCCAAGGKRPRRPPMWKSRHRRGSFNKADQLLESLDSVPNVKEEVYGALDTFVAWELDFPLITVKKALTTLEREKNWSRIIQIIKWMLGKGQGRSLGTYYLLLKAFSEEGRTEEGRDIFKKVFSRNLECTPLKMFSEIMKMYERHEMYEDILEVFADMEELNVRLDGRLSEIVSGTYEKIGDTERAYRVRLKYGLPKYRWRLINGKAVKFRNEDKDVAVSRWTNDKSSSRDCEEEHESNLAVSNGIGESESDEQRLVNETTDLNHNEDKMVAHEDSREHKSADDGEVESVDDEEFEIEEVESQQYENDPANEVYYRHLQTRNEMYV
ncbi:hypothetical protein GOP47_0009635 [Adiantum capillus-veneris]|uniref:Pentatricopeptide repeat-containing protein n=1 Tax=Adiantum capillus-veneris TaxID=13818 RepID=A0A9D4UWZ8_ADICA|nr:hypothetical protein GOP47_0009635 [Adiantum capillus-veneris]